MRYLWIAIAIFAIISSRSNIATALEQDRISTSLKPVAHLTDERDVRKILNDLDNMSLSPKQQLKNYLPNAVILAPHQNEVRGSKALYTHLQEFSQNTNLKIEHKIIELNSYDDIVVMQGKVVGRLYGEDKENYSSFRTKNIILFKRQRNSNLKIWKVIYNSAPAL